MRRSIQTKSEEKNQSRVFSYHKWVVLSSTEGGSVLALQDSHSFVRVPDPVTLHRQETGAKYLIRARAGIGPARWLRILTCFASCTTALLLARHKQALRIGVLIVYALTRAFLASLSGDSRHAPRSPHAFPPLTRRRLWIAVFNASTTQLCLLRPRWAGKKSPVLVFCREKAWPPALPRSFFSVARALLFCSYVVRFLDPDLLRTLSVCL